MSRNYNRRLIDYGNAVDKNLKLLRDINFQIQYFNAKELSIIPIREYIEILNRITIIFDKLINKLIPQTKLIILTMMSYEEKYKNSIDLVRSEEYKNKLLNSVERLNIDAIQPLINNINRKNDMYYNNCFVIIPRKLNNIIEIFNTLIRDNDILMKSIYNYETYNKTIIDIDIVKEEIINSSLQNVNLRDIRKDTKHITENKCIIL